MSPPDRTDSLSPQEKRALLERMLRERARGAVTVHPMSFSQRALWLTWQRAPDSSAYNVMYAARLQPGLDVSALERAVEALVERHAVLRTSLGLQDGALVQRIHSRLAVPVDRIDTSGWDESRLRQWLVEQACHPFDPGQGPLLRVKLLAAGAQAEGACLMLVAHHIILDGWSLEIILNELGQLYEAFKTRRAPSLPPLASTYADHARREQERVEGLDGERLRAYWQRRLGGELPTLELPTDRPHPAARKHRGGLYMFEIDARLTEELQRMGRTEGVTLYVTLLTAFGVLLMRYTGQTDLLLGTPATSRNDAESEGVVGDWVTPLPIRMDLSGDPSFRELLHWTRSAVLEDLEHQGYPVLRLMESLRGVSDPSRLFSVVFAVDQLRQGAGPHGSEGLSNALFAERLLSGQMGIPLDTDLRFNLRKLGGRLEGWCNYDADIFEEATVARLAEHFRTLLEGAILKPDTPLSQLPLLTEADRQSLRAWSHGPSLPQSLAQLVTRLIEARALSSPHAPAVLLGDSSLSFSELDRRSNQLARHLRSLGVSPETPVAVLSERSPSTVIALLAILKAGGVYVPLSPDLPLRRLELIAEDSSPHVLLTDRELPLPSFSGPTLPLGSLDSLVSHLPDSPLDDCPTPHHLAYVIYTSGSTGRPKGVLVEHRGMANLALSQAEAFDLRPGDRLLQFASLAFDVSLSDVFTCLTAGATLVLAPPGLLPGPDMLELLRAARITHLQLPPSSLAALPHGELPLLRSLVLGGEPASQELVQRWGQGRSLFNVYGPTETTVAATLSRREPSQASLPIGKPLPNVSLSVLDSQLAPVPPGIPGELFISGPGVARGYLRQPALTAERFVSGLAEQPQARMYRTGDRVRFRSDGQLEFLGRTDEQLKLRGFRIEPGEIEAALYALPEVARCAVVLREDTPGHPRMVAYVVPNPDHSLNPEALRDALRLSLPEHMVPSALCSIEALPLSPTGKLDRKALPAPEAVTSTRAFIPPATPTEEILASIWQQVLGVSQISRHDSFFELGGHSLIATQMASRASSVLPVDGGTILNHTFAASDLAGLAALIDASRGVSTPDAPIEPTLRGDALPLSFAQERLWFLEQLEPNSPLYSNPGAFLLRGPLHVEALRSAFNALVQRHEALRTTFLSVNGKPHQAIAPSLNIPLPVVDLSSLASEPREAEARRLLGEEVLRPFDLARGPLLRTTLLRFGPEEHLLILSLHHIIADGWSMSLLFRELAEAYRAVIEGRPPSLPPLRLQYADFAVWQRQWLSGSTLERQLTYWKRQFEGAPAALELHTDRPRPSQQTFAGATIALHLPEQLTHELEALSQRSGTTLFMTLLAAWATLLARYSGQDDVVVGTPIANRNLRDIEDIVGFFVNTLGLRVDLSADPSFLEVLKRTRRIALDAYAHQALPFEQLVDALELPRNLSRNPLFQVLFVLQNTPGQQLNLPGLSAEPVLPEGLPARFDLTLSLERQGEGLSGLLQYKWDLFDRETVARMAEHFRTLLEGVVLKPDTRLSRLPLLTEADRQSLRAWSHGPSLPQSLALPVTRLIEARALSSPHAPAVLLGDSSLSFSELDRRSNQLARHLRSLGVSPETPVAVLSERSPSTVIALLAILKAGGVYVPLSPDLPLRRLELIAEDSSPHVLLTDRELPLPSFSGPTLPLGSLDSLVSHLPDSPLDDCPTPHHLAYVIYTSGSTGRPKGVLVEHRGMANLALSQAEAFDLRPGDRLLQFASLAFDVSLSDVFTCLTAGATLVLAPPGLLPGPDMLQLLRAARITHLQLPSSTLAALPHGELPLLRSLILGGELASPELVRRWGEGRSLFNAYGPTETTVTATLARREPGQNSLPIGKPLPNVSLSVLDSHLAPVPPGIPGELFISGPGVARGYLRQPSLTAERFVSGLEEQPGARMYRTGDRVRFRSDGQLEFLGRTDEQLKLRGFRIEPGEIEAALYAFPEVARCAVVLREDAPGHPRLVAYIVPKPGCSLSSEALRDTLRLSLPEHMVPSAFCLIEALPLSPTGKLDRKALPAPEAVSQRAFTPPATPIEELLASIWKQILNLERVGRDDNFFELGGDSILSIQVVARATQAGLKLTTRQIFQHQTLIELAAVAAPASVIREEEVAQEGNVPLTPIQHWFFERQLPRPRHFNQSALLALPEVAPEQVLHALEALTNWHDALRLTFEQAEDGWCQRLTPPGAPVPFERVDLSSVPPEAQRQALERAAAEYQTGIQLDSGRPWKAVLFERGPGRAPRLLLVIHHLAVDAVSWRVLIEDLSTALQAALASQPITLPPRSTSWRAWAERLRHHAASQVLAEQLPFWISQANPPPPALPLAGGGQLSTMAEAGRLQTVAEPSTTDALLHRAQAAYNTRIDDLLLTALTRAVCAWSGASDFWVELEGHGREELFEDVDLSRTVGWFTALYPVRLRLPEPQDVGACIKAIKEQLRAVPDRGVGQGLLRYLGPPEARRQLAELPRPALAFNYLGQFDRGLAAGPISVADEHSGEGVAPENPLAQPLAINARVSGGQLHLDWTYCPCHLSPEAVRRLADAWSLALAEVVEHCLSPQAGGFTPSDFPEAELEQGELDAILRKYA